MSLQYVITRDEAVLDQYYALRERCFRAELGLPEFDGSEDDQDRQSHILVALRDGVCIGGVRITSRLALPSQADNLAIDHQRCCMWERFVIEPTVRKLPLIREFIGQLVEHSREIGFEHAMVLSSLCNARFYRRCLTSLGVDYHIARQVPHLAEGAFAGLEHYLSVAYLDESSQALRQVM